MGQQLPRIAILALPEATASVVSGMLDLFCSAGRDWQLVTDGEPGAQVVDARIVAQSTDPFEVANGAVVRPHATLSTEQYDIVCVPELAISPRRDRPPFRARDRLDHRAARRRSDRRDRLLWGGVARRRRFARGLGRHHALGILRQHRAALPRHPCAPRSSFGSGGRRGNAWSWPVAGRRGSICRCTC